MLINCKIPLNNDLGISAVIELGQLYKKLLEYDWIYGNLENFVIQNYIPFMEWWCTSENYQFMVDTDCAVIDWWILIGEKLEMNKETVESVGYKAVTGLTYN